MTASSDPVDSTHGIPLGNTLAVTPAALSGNWEGNLGKGVLILNLRENGSASIHLRRRVRAIYHPCTWEIQTNAIHLVCSEAQQVTFPILALSKDTLILRVGIDSVDTCLLQRTAESTNPFHP